MLKELKKPIVNSDEDRQTAATQRQRRLLFLSHAAPEDNDFVRWLSTQLAIAGYEVWCDVTELLGGERFWTDITDAIDTCTFRFLFVSTLHANMKPGTLRELKMAHELLRGCLVLGQLAGVLEVQPITRVSALASAGKRSSFNEVQQVPCCSGARCTRDREVVLSA